MADRRQVDPHGVTQRRKWIDRRLGPMPHRRRVTSGALARDVSRATDVPPQARDVGGWILRLLGLLEDHREALGKKFDLKDFDEDAWDDARRE